MLKRDLNLLPLLTTSAANIDSPIPRDCSPLNSIESHPRMRVRNGGA